MKERGILFSAPMVQAILAGKKTQTRRIIKRQPLGTNYIQKMWGKSPDGVAFGRPGHFREAGPDYPDDASDDRKCPYGIVGDRLWVRETWAPLPEQEESFAMPEYEGGGGDASKICFRADERPSNDKRGGLIFGVKKWRPAIHLPRWGSRITLEITNVRAERLQDISVDDARAEGVDDGPGRGSHLYPSPRAARGPLGYVSVFRELWEQINGRGSWSSNPWVWVVEFQRVKL